MSSSTRTCRSTVCTDSPLDFGHPAESRRADAFVVPTLENVGVEAGLRIDNGGLAGDSYVGGDLTVPTLGSYAATATTYGNVFDCITVTGAAGMAVFHLPYRLRASVSAGFSSTGGFEPSTPPFGSSFQLTCFAFDYGTPTPTPLPCPDLDERWTAPAEIDELRELTWTFPLGQPTLLQLQVQLQSALGFFATGVAGFLSGSTSAEVLVELQPAYVTEPGGQTLTGVAISAESGYDYAVPEPDGGLAGATALAALGWLLRSARHERASATGSVDEPLRTGTTAPRRRLT